MAFEVCICTRICTQNALNPGFIQFFLSLRSYDVIKSGYSSLYTWVEFLGEHTEAYK